MGNWLADRSPFTAEGRRNFTKGINVLVKDPVAAHKASPVSAAIVEPVLALPLAPARFTYNPKGFVGPGTGPLYSILPGPAKGQERLNRVAANPTVQRLSLVNTPDASGNFSFHPPGTPGGTTYGDVVNVITPWEGNWPDFDFPDLKFPNIKNPFEGSGRALLIAGLLVGGVVIAASYARGKGSSS